MNAVLLYLKAYAPWSYVVLISSGVLVFWVGWGFALWLDDRRRYAKFKKEMDAKRGVR